MCLSSRVCRSWWLPPWFDARCFLPIGRRKRSNSVNPTVQTRFSTRSTRRHRLPLSSFDTRARAHAHTHTEVRCRCSFESFRDNSSRQINLFSPRSNLFSLRETCFYISKSRGSWRSIRRWKSSCHAGNVYIYIFFHRNYEATETFSSFLLWFPRSCVSFPLPLLLSFVAPRFHYPRVTQEPRRKNRSLIGAEGIPIGVVRFASATSAIASKRRITVRTKRNGGE